MWKLEDFYLDFPPSFCLKSSLSWGALHVPICTPTHAAGMCKEWLGNDPVSKIKQKLISPSHCSLYDNAFCIFVHVHLIVGCELIKIPNITRETSSEVVFILWIQFIIFPDLRGETLKIWFISTFCNSNNNNKGRLKSWKLLSHNLSGRQLTLFMLFATIFLKTWEKSFVSL